MSTSLRIWLNLDFNYVVFSESKFCFDFERYSPGFLRSEHVFPLLSLALRWSALVLTV